MCVCRAAEAIEVMMKHHGNPFEKTPKRSFFQSESAFEEGLPSLKLT